MTTKIHYLTDACGRPTAFTLSPGNHADVSKAPALPDKCPSLPRLPADRGDDAGSLRHRLAKTKTEAVIPLGRFRKAPIPYDANVYKAGNLIECVFSRRKHASPDATRSLQTTLLPPSISPLSPSGGAVATEAAHCFGIFLLARSAISFS